MDVFNSTNTYDTFFLHVTSYVNGRKVFSCKTNENNVALLAYIHRIDFSHVTSLWYLFYILMLQKIIESELYIPLILILHPIFITVIWHNWMLSSSINIYSLQDWRYYRRDISCTYRGIFWIIWERVNEKCGKHTQRREEEKRGFLHSTSLR